MAPQSERTRIAIDAMGGDQGPEVIVAGAVQAFKEGDGIIILVGDEAAIKRELAKHDVKDLPITIVPSEGVITEDDHPARALRQKPKASILVTTNMVKEGYADASVTMGSTGAAMAAATVLLGLAKGIDRPALGGPIIGLAPRTVVIDLGSNVDCRPGQLVKFGVIGSVFARQSWGYKDPRIALLSVGAETVKGNRQVRETAELFSKSDLNFIGNIEANDIFSEKADVVVCDGFVGNIVMKLTEGMGQAIADHLKVRLTGKLQDADMRQITSEIFELNNPLETFGGAPLFGVNGVSVIGHGRSKANAVRLAIKTAKETVENNFITKLNEELSQLDEQT